MINWESLSSLPIIGGGFWYLYKHLNNKVDKALDDKMNKDMCGRIHQELNLRLDMLHEDIKYIKEKVTK